MAKNPCKKDCPKRSWDCHAHCKDYKDYEAANREEYKKRAMMLTVNTYSDNKESKLRRSMLKKAKRPGYR